MVDMIVQNVSHSGLTSLSFTVPRPDLEHCLLLVREVMEPWPGAELSFDEDMAKLSVVGIGLRTHTGVGEKMFRALADADINVQLINTSEIRICAVVAGKSGPAAARLPEPRVRPLSCRGRNFLGERRVLARRFFLFPRLLR